MYYLSISILSLRRGRAPFLDSIYIIILGILVKVDKPMIFSTKVSGASRGEDSTESWLLKN